MKSAIALLVCLLIVGFWYTVLFNRPCAGDYTGLRDGGAGWFEFGPAFIANCDCARVKILWPDDKERKWLEIEDKDKIALVKKWLINNNTERRMGFSPYWPDYLHEGDYSRGPSILLCTSDKHDFDIDSLILAIPLKPFAWGMTKREFDLKIAELKKSLE